ncbi:HAD-IC family P-type ATPase [Patescibacteria group bacterium]|nr:HAD-IC family P-type ATPase [Patescibacteria group bacterium]MBU1519457.1 HAD-IC family P-type ATPase [Patescibacteria group bacterium]MBU2416982.1 HAD-IC family P-type ATPase [Patescibacteria group bacterium]
MKKTLITQNQNLWSEITITEIKKRLNADSNKGLRDEQIAQLQIRYGKNIFKKGRRITRLDKIIAQFKSPLVIILLIAGIVTFALDHRLDTLVIFIALLINIVIGVIQEARASEAFEKLVVSQEKYATVIRGGRKKQVHAEELVPGDIIWITSGMAVPADARIITANGLSTNEAMLTGEWASVSKREGVMKKGSSTPITEQSNLLWMGTLIVAGNAKAIVVETGDSTQMGIIASELAKIEEEQTPLQKNIRKLAVFLSYFMIAILVFLFFAGVARGNDPVEMIIIAIAVAVAAMPEGLPVAVTVVLALGMETILKKGGLVRNLLATETLGSTTVILTDKTGTLTKAEMRVVDILTEQTIHNQTTTGRIPLRDTLSNHDKKNVLKNALLTAEGFVDGREDTLGEWIVRGNPVDRAIILAGLESEMRISEIVAKEDCLDRIPFDSTRRFAASLYSSNNKRSTKNRVCIVGAPELLLEYAQSVYSESKEKKLTKKTRKMLEDRQLAESATGMRIVGVAYKDVDWKKLNNKNSDFPINILEDIVFSGFIILHDPLRSDVKESIKIARGAGAEVIMLTGDNPITALKIAEEAGIVMAGANALTGVEIEQLDDKKLLEILYHQKVFARVLPSQKLRIVHLLKSQGEIVAMTGDGINDAPALQCADLGIALGSGTDVAKEASDIVLLNNSFSIIVKAIEEGRRIRDNLKKIIVYLISTSFSELFIISVAIIAMGKELPILATQILWINIIEEGFMNFAFAFEPGEADIMKRNPKESSMKEIVTPNLKKLIAIIVLTTGVFLITLYFVLLRLEIDIEKIRTIMFIALSVSSIFFAFSIKNLHKPIWTINPFSNKYLVFTLLANFGVLIIALVLPPLQTLLSLTPLSGNEFFLIIGIGLINLCIIEIGKYIVFRNK